MIAPDSKMFVLVSRSVMAGILLLGDISENSFENCSSFSMLIGMTL
jgi:hypothetical protein